LRRESSDGSSDMSISFSCGSGERTSEHITLFQIKEQDCWKDWRERLAQP
jgi:hypothetical protein